MRWIPDRFWWAQRFGGGIFVIGCLVGAISQIVAAYSISQLTSDDPIESRLLHNEAQIALLQGAVFVVFIIQGGVVIWASFGARERFRRRLRAIEGEQEAMRRAAVPVQPNHAPDLASEALELLWRATRRTSRIMTTIIAIVILIFGPCALLFWYLAYCIATNTPPIGSTYITPISPLGRVGYVAVTVFVGALLLFLVGFVIRLLPWERGRPHGVTASSDGLWYYPRMGKRRLLRWDEARLLEVSLPKNERCRAYRLYGRDSIARWLELPPSSWVSLGMTKQEFEQQHQALLDLIVARTHLLPRTLEKKLAEASGI